MRQDYTGVTAGEFPLIDEGWYPFRITVATEGESKKGNYMVKVVAECLDSRFRGMEVWHWVTFLPKENKGAGLSLHFLKCIGQPYEGVIDITPLDWEGKRFMGKVIINEYEGRKNNKFESISPMNEETARMVAAMAEAKSKQDEDEDSPFVGE